MLRVTELAAQTIKHLLESKHIDPGVCFRLERKENGKFGFSLVSNDAAAEGERLIEWEGRKVLILPGEASEALSEMTLDAKATPDGEMKLLLVQAPDA